MKLYQKLAQFVDARLRCIEHENEVWEARHTEALEQLVKEHMPSGSGFDNGTTLDFKGSTGEKLVFATSFHHMDENGMYDGWTVHKVTVKPSLLYDFVVDIDGEDRNDIKDYIESTFCIALLREMGH